MLCRYDTYALKCQDIFSVHGFPVGLVQCENNLLGIPRVGSGGFRHFVEKYRRAKAYGASPFETRHVGRRKEVVPIVGERIAADFVAGFPDRDRRQARLLAAPAIEMPLPKASLDGVFTDPPYFDNVQYAELMDFCFVWLRLGLAHEIAAFRRPTTLSPAELTGNVTLGRDLSHFTQGLSDVFRHYAAALKPGGPFVFTYHHNDPDTYVPLVVAILDAGLDCTASLPVPAEMSASLHIARTGSSILDSVFVCRQAPVETTSDDIVSALARDTAAMRSAGVPVSLGDIRCLQAGHTARVAVNRLLLGWERQAPLPQKMSQARACIRLVVSRIDENRRHTSGDTSAKIDVQRGADVATPVSGQPGLSPEPPGRVGSSHDLRPRTELNSDVDQGSARSLDQKCRADSSFVATVERRYAQQTARQRRAGSHPPSRPKTLDRIDALVTVAVQYLTRGSPINPDDVIHRLAKFDTRFGLESVQYAANEGVPYATLLYERYLGRPFAGHRDAVAGLVGEVMENAIEQQLRSAGITYRKTKRAERIPGFGQAPDFCIPDESRPSVVIEAKLTSDDGTARDKVTRIRNLVTQRDRQVADGTFPPYEVVACIDGRGFRHRREDMRQLLLALDGKVFTTATLDMLIAHTRLTDFVSVPSPNHSS